ncbi:MAG: hypothetical protein GY953_49095, partial [bacterium]|nr:hypothetical protein [bacterium]
MTIAKLKPVLGRLVTLALSFAAAGALLGLHAADRPEFSADAAFFSQYNWRGLVVTDGPVLQPALTMTYAGFSANVWGNLDLDDANDLAGKFNEVDLTFSYSRSAGKAELSAGVINYIFPNIPADATTEIFGAIGFDVPLNPSFGAYFDVDEVDGTYLTADVSHTVDFPKTSSGVATAFTLGTGLGWASENYALGYFG